jgi:hypothetical protein
MRIQLTKLAHARSGDKGDTANVGLIALREEYYPLLVREVTAERVKQHFKGICRGRVDRFELPNLGALNFLLHESLGGGGTLSLMTDAQGKTFSTALLRMEIEVAEGEAQKLG